MIKELARGIRAYVKSRYDNRYINCVVCESERVRLPFPICKYCLPEFYRLSEARCPECYKPVADCVCTGVKVYSLFWYDGASARRMIYRMKNKYEKETLAFYADLLCEMLRLRSVRAFDAVSCVPSRRKKIRRFGYGHAEVIAGAVAERLNIPFIKMLTRTSDTEQKLLSASQRKRALFLKFRPVKENCVNAGGGAYKRVLLIDDVTTTGGTIACCAALLRKQGIKQVICLTLAKTPKSKEKL